MLPFLHEPMRRGMDNSLVIALKVYGPQDNFCYHLDLYFVSYTSLSMILFLPAARYEHAGEWIANSQRQFERPEKHGSGGNRGQGVQ